MTDQDYWQQPKEAILENVNHDDMMELHPSLSRRQVWCTHCGYTKRIHGSPLRDGWPKCCGYTMTIDGPEERAGAVSELSHFN